MRIDMQLPCKQLQTESTGMPGKTCTRYVLLTDASVSDQAHPVCNRH